MSKKHFFLVLGVISFGISIFIGAVMISQQSTDNRSKAAEPSTLSTTGQSATTTRMSTSLRDAKKSTPSASPTVSPKPKKATTSSKTAIPTTFTLEPSEKKVEFPTSGIEYFISVKLLDKGKIVTDQKGITYKWTIQKSSPFTLFDQKLATCAYGIQPPCPNNRIGLRKKGEGEATIRVWALKNRRAIATTSFFVTTDKILLPEPSPIPQTSAGYKPVSYVHNNGYLKTDGLLILTPNGKKYNGVSSSETKIWAQNSSSNTLELTWQENGVEMRLFLYFSRSGKGTAADSWFITEIRTYNGESPGHWVYYTDQKQLAQFTTAVAKEYAGTGEIILTSDNMGGKIQLLNPKIKTVYTE